MTMFKILLLVALLPGMALAQTQTQTQTPAPRPSLVDPGTAALQSTRDPPLGFPYNTGGNADLPAVAQVPLRDFLSSRQDQQRAELIERIDSLSIWLQRMLDERDRQYAQRFSAQEAAVVAALASAKEAVEKAEISANDRFESVNEFRATLSDQANNFVNKSTAEARFNSLDEKVEDLFIRLNTLQAQEQGGAETWGWVFAVSGLAMLVIAFLYNARASRGVRIDA